MSEAWQLYASTLLIYAGVYAIGAMGLNLQFGLAGLINFSFIMFHAAGAYTAAILTLGPSTPTSYQQYIAGATLPFPLPILAGGVVAGCLALVVGLITLRNLRRDYEAIVMLVISLIALNLTRNSVELFNGSNGLSGIPRPLATTLGLSPYGTTYQWLYAAIVGIWFLIVFFLVWRITTAPLGRTLRAVRDNEDAAAALGKDVAALRLKTFIAGAFIAGISGGLLAQFISSWSPGNWEVAATFLYFAAVIIGGTGNNVGAVVGAVLVPVAFIEAVRFFPQVSPVVDPLRWIAVGLLVLLFLWFKPEGVIPERPKRFREPVSSRTLSPNKR